MGRADLFVVPPILNCGYRWGWVISFTLQPLYCRRKSPFLLRFHWLVVWAPEPAWIIGEEKHLLPLPVIKSRFVGCSTRGLVTLLSEISRLLFGLCRSHFWGLFFLIRNKNLKPIAISWNKRVLQSQRSVNIKMSTSTYTCCTYRRKPAWAIQYVDNE